MSKNAYGFSAIHGLVIIVALAVIGFAGWKVFATDNNQKNKTTTNSAATQTADPYAGWKEYCDTKNSYCFKYPSDWKFTSSVEGYLTAAHTTGPNEGVDIAYYYPYVHDTGPSDFTVLSIGDTSDGKQDFKILAGFYPGDTTSRYYLIGKSDVDNYGLKVAQTAHYTNNPRFDEKGGMFRLNTIFDFKSEQEIRNWFNSEDGKSSLLVFKSFHKKA